MNLEKGETRLIKTTKDAIAFSRENLKLYPCPELRDLIVQTAKIFPPLSEWKEAFKHDKGLTIRFQDIEDIENE